MTAPYYADADVIRADARSLPLPDASVDLIVTSPPYFALRSYTDGGEHYGGQIGSEATPAEYVANLLDCTREWVRVLKPSGSIWVNLGDKYTGAGGQWVDDERPDIARRRLGKTSTKGQTYGLKPKSLLGLPWRYALACIDELGLILRAEVIWSKPNGLPESVTDRVRRSHEQWFHFTVQPRYFSAVDEIRETYSENKPWGAAQRGPSKPSLATAVIRGTDPSQQQNGLSKNKERVDNPLGKLPGSVWEIATQPLTVPKELGVDHFAAFPMEWPRRIILGWSPAGICTACGEGRRPMVDKEATSTQRTTEARSSMSKGTAAIRGVDRKALETIVRTYATTITGYACACPEPTAQTRPAVVLDPFGGTGTTALVASALGRHGISVDRSADYCRLAQWRVNDPGQRAAAMQVDKPEPVHRDQLELEWEMTA